jgi:hypothetical protein
MDAAPAPEAFGTARLFLADSRLALLVLNHARLAVMRSVFGVSREQANLLTFVLALGAAEGAYVTARRAIRAPLRVRDEDVGIAALALRSASGGRRDGRPGPAGRAPRDPGAPGRGAAHTSASREPLRRGPARDGRRLSGENRRVRHDA